MAKDKKDTQTPDMFDSLPKPSRPRAEPQEKPQ